MSITKEEVLYIARLARLELSDDEVLLFTEQMGKILDYVKKLNELESSQVEGTAHAISLTNVFRNDEVSPFSDKEKILSNAPDRQEDCFRVPRIIED